MVTGCVFLGIIALFGVGGADASPTAAPVPAPSHYWNRNRLLRATPFSHGVDSPARSGVATSTGLPSEHTAALRVGALFSDDESGSHFCTASVVDSPGENLLITAAHCISSGDDSDEFNTNIVFIPGYRNGETPFGVWTPEKMFVPPEWAKSGNPDYDIGFITLRPLKGKNIEQVLGANHLVTDATPPYNVHVTGYPASTDEPVSCANDATAVDDTQQEFVCGGLPSGTSGSPWVTNFDHTTHTGDIVGVIGGYQLGGDSPDVSYSIRFGPSVRKLYDRAVATEHKPRRSSPRR